MEDANDIIKEIIYRSADECNNNNEELNFPCILKYFYNVTNKYNITKQCSEEIFNKLVIICKNIIEDKVTYQYPKKNINGGGGNQEEKNITSIVSMKNAFTNSDSMYHYKDYPFFSPGGEMEEGIDLSIACHENKTTKGVHVCQLKHPCGHYTYDDDDVGIPYAHHISYHSMNSCKMGGVHGRNDKKMTNLVKKGIINQDEDIIYNFIPANKINIMTMSQKMGETKNKIKSLLNVNQMECNSLVIDEKSFMHKNNRNLLKIYLNGDLICNVYRKLCKQRRWKNPNANNITNVKNKMKLYNESNVFYTFYTLKTFFNLWLFYLKKKRELRKNAEKYNKIFNTKLLTKYYDEWLYRYEKKMYMNSVSTKLFHKRKKNLLRKHFNMWICKYKKKKKKNFIYSVHILSEWRTYTQRVKMLQRAKNIVEKKKKKKFFAIWRQKYQIKLLKKEKNKQIENVYNKNLLIKCYVHFVLYYKKRKKERNSYTLISNYTNFILYQKYFNMFLNRYQEEVHFKQYYNQYIQKIKILHLKKYFTILKRHIRKMKNLRRTYNLKAEQNATSLLNEYFITWMNTHIESKKITFMLTKHDEKRSYYLLKKFFTILKRHKNKSFNLKKKFLFLYEKKNRNEMAKIFDQWKNYYSINATHYILLYNKYKYKLLIRHFQFLHKYKNHRKKRKLVNNQIQKYFIDKVKKNTFTKWKYYIYQYKKDLLHYYHFNDEGNFFSLFMFKLLLKYQFLSTKTNGKTLLDIVNFSNININMKTFIYIHKKYFLGKNLLPNVSIFYENVMFIYRSLNIIFSLIPIPFVVNLRKLRYNLPYLSFSLKMAIYKCVFSTWKEECKKMKVLKAESKRILQKIYLSHLRELTRKKKMLEETKKRYNQDRRMKIKSKIFSTWFSLRMKYFMFRKKFQIYGCKNREKKMRKILQSWLYISRLKSEKKKKILQFFKSLLMKKKKLYFYILLKYVNKKRKKKIKEKIAKLYCIKKYKKRAFKALFIYSKNILYLNTLNKISESYLKRMCIQKWKNLMRQFLDRRQGVQNLLNHFNSKVMKRFLISFFVYVRLRQIKRRKIAHLKHVQAKILAQKYMNAWSTYIRIRKSKTDFLKSMTSLFSRKKKIKILSKWYTVFIMNIRFKETEKIISTKMCILYFSKLFLYKEKMKRIELFLKNRMNVINCLRILKEWKKFCTLEKKEKEINNKRFLSIKKKYFKMWKNKYEKVRKRKNEQAKIQYFRQIKNMNILRNINNEWKNKCVESKNIKLLIHAMNKYFVKKWKCKTFIAIYKNSNHYCNIQMTLNNFLVEKRCKLKRKIFYIFKRNKTNRVKNKKATLFFFSNMKTKAFSALQFYRERQIKYRTSSKLVIINRKKKYFYAIFHFFNFIKRAKLSFYEIRINGENNMKRRFFTLWSSFLMKKKRERKTFLMIQRHRENKIKGKIFFHIKRNLNKKKYLILLFDRIDKLIKVKMSHLGVYKIRMNSRCAIIREKILARLEKGREEKTVRKAFKALKCRLKKSKKRKVEKEVIRCFHSNLMKKKYFRFLLTHFNECAMRRKENEQKLNENYIAHFRRTHFLLWHKHVKRKKRHKQIYNLVILKKKARVFLVLLYTRAQNCYRKIMIVKMIYSLIYPDDYRIPSFYDIIYWEGRPFGDQQEREHYNDYNCTYEESLFSFNQNHNEGMEDMCSFSRHHNCKSGNIIFDHDKETHIHYSMTEIYEKMHTLITLNRIHIQMSFKNKKNRWMREKYFKGKNIHFNKYIKICYDLKNCSMNRLILMYLLMYDSYDMHTFFIHFKKKFKFLYNFFFNFLSIKTKKLLMKVFKKNQSFYFTKLINMKDEDVISNLKILLLIYYLIGTSYLAMEEKNGKNSYGKKSSLQHSSYGNNVLTICSMISAFNSKSKVSGSYSLKKYGKISTNVNNKRSHLFTNEDELTESRETKEEATSRETGRGSKFSITSSSELDIPLSSSQKSLCEFLSQFENSSSSSVTCTSSIRHIGMKNSTIERTLSNRQMEMQMGSISKASIRMVKKNRTNTIGMATVTRRMSLKKIRSDDLEKNIMEFFKKLKSGISNRFRGGTLNIHFSFMCCISRNKLIQVHLFFKKLKRSTIWWKRYSMVKKINKKEDKEKVDILEGKKKGELLEKYFGIWILSFNTKVKEIKNKRKQILKKHIHLLFSYWYKLIKVENYDKEKFYRLKEQTEFRIKRNYLKNFSSIYAYKKKEKKSFSIIMKHSNEKRKRTFFYVWLLLYQYAKKGYIVKEFVQKRLLKFHFENWVGLYAKKQIYIFFIQIINENFLKKVFIHTIQKIKYFNFIKRRICITQKKYFLIHYNLVKRNKIIKKLQLHIYCSFRFNQMKNLFFYWNGKYKKRKKCTQNYNSILERRKCLLFHRWVKYFIQNVKMYEEKKKKLDSFFLKRFFQKWIQYHHYKKTKKIRKKILLQFYFQHLRRKCRMSVALKEHIRNAQTVLKQKIFAILKGYKNYRTNNKRIQLYCMEYRNKLLLEKCFTKWITHYAKCRKVKKFSNHLTVVRHKQIIHVTLNGWLLQAKRRKKLKTIYNIIKVKKNKQVQKIFHKWKCLYHFATRRRNEIVKNHFYTWVYNFKFCIFITRLNRYIFNIYTKHIFSFYYILKKKNEKYMNLAKGHFPFVRKQIRELLQHRTIIMSNGFTALKKYKDMCKILKINLVTYEQRMILKLKKRHFFLLLNYKNKNKNKINLQNLFLKYTIERKFHLCKKFFFILTNLYFYNNHLRLCERTIQCRRERRILRSSLNQWASYKNYCKENEYLENLCNDFLTYRRKSEFLISLKQFYVENKWKNYCEYNSLIFYKNMQQKMLLQLISYWYSKSLRFREMVKKRDELREKFNRNIVKKYFFVLIFSINKIKIEKKNYDIVRFKKEKIIKQNIFNFMHHITNQYNQNLQHILKIFQEKRNLLLVKKFASPFLRFLLKKINLRKTLSTRQQRNDTTVLKKYFYSFIFKYVTNVNHYKYYYYNKYLSLWKYYVVMSNKASQEFPQQDEEEGDSTYMDGEKHLQEKLSGSENRSSSTDESSLMGKKSFEEKSYGEKSYGEKSYGEKLGKKKPNHSPLEDSLSENSSEYTRISRRGLHRNDLKWGKGEEDEHAIMDFINSSIDSSETKEDSDISYFAPFGEIKL
ncbi:hypothetical protein, conserved [Plasmodium gonderi]|uniref:Uncharacterized protein n=1 Tax=Plasmodium gonderi TaxID=77519 RepID=A0A1Y1JCK3_PLAGO|nr:hypothetical protein, conserved [Plasmodium gonderi]GAW78937.1 hypothetical protein, conserved [Plasmodium gonderi]